MMISAIVGNESTNYNYACVSIEKLSDLCVCCTRLWESHRGMSVRIHARSMDSKTSNPRTIDRLQDSKSTHDRWIPRLQIHARSMDSKTPNPRKIDRLQDLKLSRSQNRCIEIFSFLESKGG